MLDGATPVAVKFVTNQSFKEQERFKREVLAVLHASFQRACRAWVQRHGSRMWSTLGVTRMPCCLSLFTGKAAGAACLLARQGQLVAVPHPRLPAHPDATSAVLRMQPVSV